MTDEYRKPIDADARTGFARSQLVTARNLLGPVPPRRSTFGEGQDDTPAAQARARELSAPFRAQQAAWMAEHSDVEVAKCTGDGGGGMIHGSNSTYCKLGCRCEECKAAHTARTARYRAENLEKERQRARNYRARRKASRTLREDQ